MTRTPVDPNDVLHCASPDASATAPHPAMVVPPLLKLMFPVGLKPVTRAVKVTDPPTTMGEAVDCTTTAAAAALTTSPPASVPVLGALVESPE